MSSIEIIFSGYKILSKNPNSINIKALNQFWGNFLGKIRQKPHKDQGDHREAFAGNGRNEAVPHKRAAFGPGLLDQFQINFIKKGK